MKNNEFTADFFIQNRRRLIETVGDDIPIVLAGNGLMQRNSDNTYPFRQDSSFWYLTGCEEPNAWVLLHKGKETLVLPKRDEIRLIFDGQEDTGVLAQQTGLANIVYETDGWSELLTAFKQHKRYATLFPGVSYDKDSGMFTSPARAKMVDRIKQACPKAKPFDIREILMGQRFIKQFPEVNAIRHAVDVTCQAITFVQGKISKYEYEYQLEADIQQVFKRNNMNTAYSSIIAAGKNACTLHYIQNSQKTLNNQVVLIDVGAEYYHYAADITRTLVKGKPSQRQKLVIAAVAEAAEYGVGLLKPGVSFYECQKKLRSYVGEKLLDLGLIKKADAASISRYFPHASHYLGLDVHDVGDYHRPLEPGVVLTIEPGIYIPEENIGVRIEDDVLITNDGCEVLSKQLPKHFLID